MTWKVGDRVRSQDLGSLPVGTELRSRYGRSSGWGVRKESGKWVYTDYGSQTYGIEGWADGASYDVRIHFLPEKVWKVGDTVTGKDYESVPVGTGLKESGSPEPILVKLASGNWRDLGSGSEYRSNELTWSRTICDLLAPWELDLLTAPVKADSRVQGDDWTYNPERGTVYSYGNYVHRDFGRVVKLPNGQFLAVPTRPTREFATEKEAIAWLV